MDRQLIIPIKNQIQYIVITLCFFLQLSTGINGQTLQPNKFPLQQEQEVNNEKSDLTIGWFDPYSTPGEVPLFEKLELGVNFPLEINQAIAQFIKFSLPPNNGSILANDKVGINPFNPEDIDIKAEFSYFLTDSSGNGRWTNEGLPSVLKQAFEEQGIGFPVKVNGFYYKELKRNLNGPSVRWKWNPNNMMDDYNSEFNFRIRFAPPLEGKWKCNITANIGDTLVLKSNPIKFECVSSSNPGYVRVGSNKRYLTLGGETFFPVGRNITQPQCWHPESEDPYNCDAVVKSIGWDNGSNNPAYYLSFLDELTSYANSGGDYFRTLLWGEHFDIEFEKLNNYYERMHEAWEFDRVVDHCKALGLKIHLNMQNHEAFQRIGDFTNRYDWLSKKETDNWFGCGQSRVDDVGYCYHSELGVETPTDFLTDADAQKYYQYRLRYITSRWGYSTAISVIELRSEMNNHAKIKHCDGTSTMKPYHTLADDDFPEKVFQWNKVMFNYLKSHQHFPHITAVVYTGSPTSVQVNKPDNNKYVSKIQHGDSSYYIKEVDLASYNHYAATPNKFVGTFNVFKDLNLEYNPRKKAIKHGLIDKPLISSETGTPHYQECSQDIEYIKDVWLSAFTGVAMSSMQWHYQHRPELTIHFKNLRKFTKGINFNGGKEGSWLPYHQERKDKRTSLFCLHSKEKRRRAIGVVVNNTVNYWTMSDSSTASKCRSVNEPRPPFNVNQSAEYSGGNSLKIPNMRALKHYEVKWYNAITMKEILPKGEPSYSWSDASGHLTIKHPTLSDNMDTPIICFKVKRKKASGFITEADRSNQVIRK